MVDSIELDGARELLRCPHLADGWASAQIRVSLDSELWHLPRAFNHLQQAWEARHPNERSDRKVALREVHIDRDDALHCRLQATAWREVRPLHEAPRREGETIARRNAGGYEMLLPNIGVVHVIAATRDGWVLMFRRSSQVHYHPNAWSATYEEGLDPSDVGDNAVFQRAAERGFREELAPHWGAIPLTSFRILSIILERPLGNPAIVVLADLPMSCAEVSELQPSDEMDPTARVAVPVDLNRLHAIVTASAFTYGSHSSPWHPTARYRVLLAIAHFFGEPAMADVLSRLRGGHSAG